ncbi:MAG: helix-turn-helix domain-containing protein [Pseudomonadota bacterium]
MSSADEDIRSKLRSADPGEHAVALGVVLKALSDPVRLDIVRTLIQAEGCGCRAAAGPDIPKATLSRHFTVLRNAGVVESWIDEDGVYRNRVRADCLEARFPGLLKSVLSALE